MILKSKPKHLQGVLNFPGGKVEDDEGSIVAAERELQEETGLESLGLSEIVGTIWGHSCVITVVKVPVGKERPLVQRGEETEPVAWYDLKYLCSHPDLMPNLRVAIPLIQAGYKGWEIMDRDGDFRQKYHTVELYFDVQKNVGWEPMKVTVPGMAYYKRDQ